MSGKVLVTGASGFIGRHVVPELVKRGYAVVGVSRHSSPPGDVAGAEWRKADLLDQAAVRRLMREVKPRFLLHLAWYVDVGKFFESPLNAEWLECSKVLLDEFMSHGGERLVAAGTVAEYENAAGVCRDTIAAPEPRTSYAKAKYELFQYLERMQPTATSWAWGRVFPLYGPNEKRGRLVSDAINTILHGQYFTVKSGRLVRDYSHVADVAAALVALLDSNVSGAVNIGSGEGITLQSLVQGIADRIGKPELARFDDQPPPGEPLLLVSDSRRLREEVGFAPRFDLSSGLDHTISWWREQIS